MLALDEKQHLIQAISRLVYEEINNVVRPLTMRIEQLEKTLGDMPVPVDGKDGAPGKDGIDGKDGRDGVDGQPGLAGKDGVDGKDGRDGVDGKDGLAGANGADGLPGIDGKDGQIGAPGKDGRDGIDGTDGENLSLDDVRECLVDLVAKAVSQLPVPKHCTGGYINRDGALCHTFSDGSIVDLGAVVGKDGKDCDMEATRVQVAAFLAAIEKPRDGKDGKDGVGFDDVDMEYDGERTLSFVFFQGTDKAKSFDFILPIPLVRDVWRAGNYKRGDITIRGGSMYLATKDTATAPGLPDSDWKLCTKCGRDGKDGKQGPPGPEGKAGRNGLDLTQRGPDGSKW